MARSEDKIKEGAKSLLEPGEEMLAAIVARPRGWTQASASSSGGALAGVIGGEIGRRKQQKQVGAAGEVDFELANPMALAVTSQRLLSISITAPIGAGIGMKVQELVSAVPLSDVDSIEVKRLAVGKVVTVTVRGNPFKLEVGAGANAKGVAQALEQAKATV
jgi:hypothetical protein